MIHGEDVDLSIILNTLDEHDEVLKSDSFFGMTSSPKARRESLLDGSNSLCIICDWFASLCRVHDKDWFS